MPQKVSVSGLSIAFGATRALERVSLAVNDGEFVSIVGPSGCGKSTMDEPFGALDAQTRLIIQEEFLKIWERQRKTVLFVTHDLQEAIALSDRVVLISARPGRIKATYQVDLPRPRHIESVLAHPRFMALFQEIWASLKQEVLAARERPA